MSIILNLDPEITTSEPQAVIAAIKRAQLRAAPYTDTGIHAFEPRNNSGFLQILIVFKSDTHGNFVQGQSMTVGMIQRTRDAEFEFHS